MIDQLAEQQAQQKALTDLVSGRNVTDELAKTRANVNRSRASVLGSLSDKINAVSPEGNSLMSRVGTELDPQTQRALDVQKLDMTRKKQTAIFNTAYDKAVSAGYNVQQAKAYARQIADQQTQFQAEAGIAEQGRQSKRNINDINNEAARSGVALTQQYANNNQNNMYTAAALRLLLGSGTAIATNKYLYNKFPSTTGAETGNFTPSPVMGDTTYGPENDQGYYPAGYTGR